MNRPLARSASHHLRKEMQTGWNKLVDEYINQCEDPRSKEEIESLAKIGSGNGALIRRCENAKCGKLERNGEKFNCCSGCKYVSL
jgi:hypothetical protein